MLLAFAIGILAIAVARAAETNIPAIDESAIVAAIESIRVEDLKTHVGTLASDALQGREAGTVNGHAASAYLVRELRQRHVSPAAGEGQFLQEFHGGMRNVLATVRGRDTHLAEEAIIVCAHFDHVGFGTAKSSRGPIGYIHNGADDNASGTAAVLEVIDAIQSLPQPPRRTLLFAFWDGEEKGLLGSKHWVSSPTIPLTRIKLVINADMVGRLRPEGIEVTGFRVARGLRQMVADANSSVAITPGRAQATQSSELADRDSVEQGRLFPPILNSAVPDPLLDSRLAPKATMDFTWILRADSDHHPFITAGVPALMLHTGKHDDYHRPSDDADKLNYAGIQRIARLMLLLALRAAEANELPTFRSEGRLETEARQKQLEQPLAPPPSRLGIAWKADLAQRFVEVLEVVPRSSADIAGLRVGDHILKLGNQSVGDFPDFRTLVMTAPTSTTINVERASAAGTLDLPIRLAGEPTRLGIAWRTDDAEPNCVILTQVLDHSPANIAGLKSFDRLLSIGGQPITSSDAFRQQAQLIASPIAVKFERAGVIETTDITTP